MFRRILWEFAGITDTSLPEGWASSVDYAGPRPDRGIKHKYTVYVFALKDLSREQRAAPETPLLRLRNSWMLSTPMPTAIQAISSPSAAYQVITPESNPEIIPHIGNYSQSKKPVNALFTGFFMEPFVGLEPTTC